MGIQKLTDKEFKEKYKNGRECTICKNIKDIEEFRFTKDGIYRGNCNKCNKLISYIQLKRRDERKEKGYIKNLIKHHKIQIKRLEYIIKHVKKTDTKIAKIIMKNGANHED